MDKLLRYGGIGLMFLGVAIILSALPIVPQSVVRVGEISAEVSEFSATRIIVGVVISTLGYGHIVNPNNL